MKLTNILLGLRALAIAGTKGTQSVIFLYIFSVAYSYEIVISTNENVIHAGFFSNPRVPFFLAISYMYSNIKETKK